MTDKKEVQLKVVESQQDDAYKGIARIDSDSMHELGIVRGDVVLIKGNRETVAIADRAYPADVGEGIIRIDGILRRNAKTGIGEMVKISKAEIKEAKKVIIAPAEKNVMVQADPENLRRGLLGRAMIKGDIIALGGVRRRKDLFSEEFGEDFRDMLGGLGDMFGGMGFGQPGGGFTQIKFVIVNTTPSQSVVITENTEVTLNPKGIEVTEENKPEIKIIYEDIGGLTEEIEKIREMVELPLRHPEIFDKLGIEPPKGVLLHGPPGTGKTLLAKAVANESDANFILLNGPEIMSKFYGESEKKIRDIFEEAEKTAPSIIFIDEIDAIAPKREDVQGEVERRVVSQLLTMMDGLNSRGKVIVIGATNRINAIDPALRRPGRFDREIEINVPDQKGRLSILKIHTRNMPLYYWDLLEAGKIMIKKLKSFESISNSKIEERKLKINSLELESEQIQREMNLKLKKMISEKKEFERRLEDLKLDYKNLRLKETETSNEDILSKIRRMIRARSNEILEIEETIRGCDIKLTKVKSDIEKTKNDYENKLTKVKSDIEKTKNDILKISKRMEQIESKDKNIKILSELVSEIGELRHQILIRDSDDIRKTFYDLKLDEKNKEINSILEDLIETGIVSSDYMSEVIRVSVGVMLDKIASVSYGFVGADIAALAREAAMCVLKRELPDIILQEDKISKETLRKLEILESDFNNAKKAVRPSAMREVLVEIPNMTWNDIGGLNNIKQELKEAVEWPLKFPENFERLGIKPPRGLLLYGPPGTGKTLLAKAVAKESQANFIQVKGPSLLSMWVGESEKGVRKIFERARQVSPCIIFFDELDALAGRRGVDAGTKVTERVLNQLLAEMDGIEETTNIVVIGATNRPDMLDPAILRPGRFDRILLVSSPDKGSREDILKIHTKKVPLSKDVDLIKIAEKIDGYSGADIEALVREAAMLALRENKGAKQVSNKNFEEAMNKVKPSISKRTIESYKKIEEDYLKSAKAALVPEASYLG